MIGNILRRNIFMFNEIPGIIIFVSVVGIATGYGLDD
jgi:hypothetical protein